MGDSEAQESEEHQLGDYRLVALLAEDAHTRTYRAEQISIARIVLLVRLREEARQDARLAREFRGELRAKAAVDHPGIGSVYEAVDDGEALYYTGEYLGHTTFEDLRAAGVTFPPAAIAGFLRQIGSAMEYLAHAGIATRALEARHLYLGNHDVVRLANLAGPAEPDRHAIARDRELVAQVCLDLLRRGVPGATRASTLLHMLADREGEPLGWGQLSRTARKLAYDLSEGAKVASQALASGPLAESPRRPQPVSTLAGLLLTLVILAALAVGGLLLTRPKSPPEARDLSAMIEIPAGYFLSHDGKPVQLPRFWIDAHEVSIAEYAAFLEALEALPAEKRGGYDHPEQPAAKRDHLPDEWAEMLAAARRGASFDGLPTGPNYPVVQVDWWDAYAYANWKGARLPTQEEWFAATQDGALTMAERGPVDRLPGDVTPRGVHGMAGNVSEWVLEPAKNPAFPMNPKAPLCCGASFAHPPEGARARRWLPDRESRRPDLGFRTVRETAP